MRQICQERDMRSGLTANLSSATGTTSRPSTCIPSCARPLELMSCSSSSKLQGPSTSSVSANSARQPRHSSTQDPEKKVLQGLALQTPSSAGPLRGTAPHVPNRDPRRASSPTSASPRPVGQIELRCPGGELTTSACREPGWSVGALVTIGGSSEDWRWYLSVGLRLLFSVLLSTASRLR